MKARIKATGEIVEAMYSHIAQDGEYDIVWYVTQQGAFFSKEELEFIDTGESLDYWTRLEHQYAGMAMQGLMSRNCLDNPDSLVSHAIHYAHALVEKMKEERK